MADFQNRLISRTFGVFSIGFLHRTSLTSTWLNPKWIVFCMIFSSHFSNFDVFPIFQKTTKLTILNVKAKLTILQKLQPLHDGRFLKSSHFPSIWRSLNRFFPQNNSNMIKKSFFACFFEFEFLTQTDYFAKATAFAWWPIFKIVSFLEYLVFLKRSFAENNSNMIKESFVACFLEC